MTIYRYFCAIVLGCLTVTTLSAQTTNPIQTGYVVITPLDGIPDGLVAFGNLTLTSGTQSSVGIFANSSLVNAATIPISTDSTRAQNTGVAIVNPNTQTATISLVLRLTDGSTPLLASFTLDGGKQTSQFVTEVFGNKAIAQGVPAVLVLVSNLPVGVVAFNFQGTNFAAVPVTDLTTVLTAADLASLNSDINSRPIPTATTSSSSLKPATIGGMDVQVSNTTPAEQFFPQISSSVGGDGAFMLPQLAMNGGWTSAIIIVNPSNVSRTVRLDFFDATGARMNVQFQTGSGFSFSRVTIPASGSVVFMP